MSTLVDAGRPRPTLEAAGVAEDLRRRVEGEVLFDSVHRTLYSTAACIYQVMPLGAVVARHEGDVLAVLEYARSNRTRNRMNRMRRGRVRLAATSPR